MTTLTLTGHAEQQQTKTYVHVPFDVPEGTGRIDVRYQYSDQVGSDPHLTNGNTVDIGIFDPRGIQFLTDGFRGWSGSARQEFFISGNEATPAYLPGTIQPGTWNVCLGLYKVAPQGCDYQIDVTLTPGESAGSLAPLLPLRTTPGRIKPDGWYCGEMHNHTYHSDGDSDPLDVVRRVEQLGLDFLAITDHNSLSHLARLNEIDTPLMLIPGIEVTTFRGHWNVWGDQGWIDFRITDEAHMAQAIAEAATARLPDLDQSPAPVWAGMGIRQRRWHPLHRSMEWPLAASERDRPGILGVAAAGGQTLYGGRRQR